MSLNVEIINVFGIKQKLKIIFKWNVATPQLKKPQ